MSWHLMCIDILVEENVCLYIEIFLKNPILENTQDGEKWGEIWIGAIFVILSQHPIQNTHYFFHTHQQPIEIKLWTQS
jgi:hypothetical protein